MSVFMRVGSDGFSCLFKESQPELWIKRHCAASYTNAHIAADSLMVCTCVLMRVEVRTLIFERPRACDTASGSLVLYGLIWKADCHVVR